MNSREKKSRHAHAEALGIGVQDFLERFGRVILALALVLLSIPISDIVSYADEKSQSEESIVEETQGENAVDSVSDEESADETLGTDPKEESADETLGTDPKEESADETLGTDPAALKPGTTDTSMIASNKVGTGPEANITLANEQESLSAANETPVFHAMAIENPVSITWNSSAIEQDGILYYGSAPTATISVTLEDGQTLNASATTVEASTGTISTSSWSNSGNTWTCTITPSACAQMSLGVKAAYQYTDSEGAHVGTLDAYASGEAFSTYTNVLNGSKPVTVDTATSFAASDIAIAAPTGGSVAYTDAANNIDYYSEGTESLAVKVEIPLAALDTANTKVNDSAVSWTWDSVNNKWTATLNISKDELVAKSGEGLPIAVDAHGLFLSPSSGNAVEASYTATSGATKVAMGSVVPVASITVDGTDAANGAAYDAYKDIAVSITAEDDDGNTTALDSSASVTITPPTGSATTANPATDASSVSATLTPTEDGAYVIKVENAKTIQGRSIADIERTVYFDGADPNVTITPTSPKKAADADSDGTDDTWYYDAAPSVAVSVWDAVKIDSSDIQVIEVRPDGSESTLSSITWSGDGTQASPYTANIALDDTSGEHAVKVVATDRARHAANAEQDNIWVDTTTAQISFEYKRGTLENIADAEENADYAALAQEIKNAFEASFGNDRTDYFKNTGIKVLVTDMSFDESATKVLDKDNNLVSVTWTSSTNAETGLTTWTSSEIDYSAEGKYELKVDAVDMVGSTETATYRNVERQGLTVDATAPGVKITALNTLNQASTGSGPDWYSPNKVDEKDVMQFSIDISDTGSGFRYAIVKCEGVDLTPAAFKDGSATSATIDIPASTVSQGLTVIAYDKAMNYVEYAYGDKETVNCSTVQNNGTTLVDGTSFAVAPSNPVLSVDYGATAEGEPGVDSHNVHYYQSDRSININVIDWNLVASNYSVKLNNGTSDTEYVNWGEAQADLSHILSLPTVSETSTPYTLEIYGHDEANNPLVDTGNKSLQYTSASPYQYSFMIDKEDPVIADFVYSVSSAGSLGEGDNAVAYYDADELIATITVTETNFDPANSTIELPTGAAITQDWTKDTSDSSKWSAIVKFTGENAAGDTPYSFKVTAKDYAGRTAVKDSGKLVLDKTAPQISASYSTAPIGKLGDIDYYDDSVTAIITVKDNNFEPDTESWSAIIAAGTKSELKWTQDGSDKSKWTATIVFGENLVDVDDAVSTLAASAVDKVYVASGGDASAHKADCTYGTDHAGVEKFVVDKTAPDVTVNFDQKVNSTFEGKDFYGSAETLTAIITVVDNNFDTSISPVTAFGETGSWSGSWNPINASTYTTTVTYSENKGNTSTLALDLIADRVYSAATNKSAVAQSHSTSYTYGAANTTAADGTVPAGTSFVLDLTAPDLTHAAESADYSTKWGDSSSPYLFYRSDASGVTVLMWDANGIRFASAEAPFALSGKATDVGTSDTQVVALIEGSSVGERDANNNQMRTALVKLTDYAGNYSVWSISPDGTVYRVTSGTASRENTSIDIHDGSSVHPLYMVLDRVAPYLSWGATPSAGAYYNSSQSATVNVSELNFDLLQNLDGGRIIAIVSKQEGNAGRASSSWAVPANAFAGGGSDWSSRIDFTTEGHYSVYAQFEDIAGNASNAISLGEFTLDWTAPVIQDITFDNNDVRNGKYYKAGRTATITIVEHNWDPSLVTINTNGGVSGWSDNGDTHTCTVSFLTDGDYNLSVSCTDKAGNAAESKSVPEFTVDLTAPTITFTEVSERTAYNDTIAPVINYADEKNFDANGMQYTLTGSKNGAQAFSASQGSSGNQGTVTFSDFPRQVESDDIYTLTAHLTDLAGNEANGSITFSVNRFGSNFIILNAQDYADGYLANPQEIIVQEVNVSGVESEKSGVSVTHGLTTENLQSSGYGSPSSEGFYIVPGSDSSGWSSYLYHIGSGNFKEDGNYHVVISSTDTATNLNNSASYYDPDKHEVANAEVSFILDTADPIIDGLNVSNNGTYDANNTTVNFNVIDNIGCKQVEVTVDGQTYSSANSSEVNLEANGYCTVNIPAKTFAARDMQIVASDYAGRIARADVNGFHFTDNFFELNMLLILGGAVVIAAAVAGGVLYSKRRNQSE